MNWITDIPKAFLAIMAIIGLIGTAIFIMGLDFGNTAKANENLIKVTGFMVEEEIPTEVNWISGITIKLQNHPFILIGLIIALLWLFGYFLPENSRRR
jgi:hypothetical protein